MQSTTLVFLRSMVMLLCLVAIPLVALFGTANWPKSIESLMSLGSASGSNSSTRQEKRARELPPESSNLPNRGMVSAVAPGELLMDGSVQPLPAAARVSSGNPAAAVGFEQPANTAPAALAAVGSPPSPSESSAPQAFDLRVPAFWPATVNNEPLHILREVRETPPPAAQAADRSPAPPAEVGRAAPAGYFEPIRPGDKPLNAGGSAPKTDRLPASSAPPAASIPPPNDSSGQPPPAQRTSDSIQERLKQLGAAHYRLETWGTQGELFRFQAKMALEANPNYIRYFEAVEADPLAAMQKVLSQVEAWKRRP